jgi:hypothetical protein
VDALGSSRDGRFALWQILARTIAQGSRLSATRLARNHEIDFLELGTFDEDSLYKNLGKLVKHQSDSSRRNQPKPSIKNVEIADYYRT